MPPESPDRIVTDPGGSMKKNNNGSLIAVSYEARAFNVRRGDRGLDAKEKCKDLVIVQVPVKHGKADLSIYRNASARIVDALVHGIRKAQKCLEDDKISVIVEKASIDEIYVDISEGAHLMAKICCENNSKTDFFQSARVITTIGGLETANSVSSATNALSKHEVRRGSSLQVLDSASELDSGSNSWWYRTKSEWTADDTLLACGAEVASIARRHVFETFGFTLSAGISCNKTLAKLASGMKKPNRQTLVNPLDSYILEKLFHPLPLDRIRGLGGKFGQDVKNMLKVPTIGELAKIPLSTLISKYPEQGYFLFSISQGICKEEVCDRVLNKSIVCSKNFRGATAIIANDQESIVKQTGKLCDQLCERISIEKEDNQRIPKLLVTSVRLCSKTNSRTISRSCPWPQNHSKILELALSLIDQVVVNNVPKSLVADYTLQNILLNGTNFIPFAADNSSIVGAFKKQMKTGTQGKSSQNSKKLLFGKTGTMKTSINAKGEMNMARWLSQAESSPKSSFSKRKKNFDIDSNNIDHSVLKELPQEIQESILNDMKVLPKKKKTIASFFKP